VPDAGERVPGVVTPRLYRSVVSHTRRAPLRHSFRNTTHLWLVDLDDLPDHGMLARFEARDHLGDPDRGIRENIEAFLAADGIDVAGGRILMAANARAFGHCFNPISVFWCHDAAGNLAGTVVEVHNTYGDRHAYLVHTDERGRAQVAKAMYVSPFHGTDGHYQLTVPVPTERLHIVVRLVTDDGTVFDAALRGCATDAGALRAAPAAALGSLKIRLHGIWLWARRLEIRPRPDHQPQEGV